MSGTAEGPPESFVLEAICNPSGVNVRFCSRVNPYSCFYIFGGPSGCPYHTSGTIWALYQCPELLETFVLLEAEQTVSQSGTCITSTRRDSYTHQTMKNDCRLIAHCPTSAPPVGAASRTRPQQGSNGHDQRHDMAAHYRMAPTIWVIPSLKILGPELCNLNSTYFGPLFGAPG